MNITIEQLEMFLTGSQGVTAWLLVAGMNVIITFEILEKATLNQTDDQYAAFSIVTYLISAGMFSKTPPNKKNVSCFQCAISNT